MKVRDISSTKAIIFTSSLLKLKEGGWYRVANLQKSEPQTSNAGDRAEEKDQIFKTDSRTTFTEAWKEAGFVPPENFKAADNVVFFSDDPK